MVMHSRRTAWCEDLELRAQREAELRSEQATIIRNAVRKAESRRMRRFIVWLICGLGIVFILIACHVYLLGTAGRILGLCRTIGLERWTRG